MDGGKAMAARAEIGGALSGRRWAITSEAGAAGLTALSVRVWPAPVAVSRKSGAAGPARGAHIIFHRDTEGRS